MEFITTEEFKNSVMDYTKESHKFIGKKPTIIKFTSSWCSPCKMMAPILEELQNKYPEIDIFNLDVDDEPEPASAFGIRSIPNMIFFPMEGDVERMVGAMPRKTVDNAIKRVFKL